MYAVDKSGSGREKPHHWASQPQTTNTATRVLQPRSSSSDTWQGYLQRRAGERRLWLSEAGENGAKPSYSSSDRHGGRLFKGMVHSSRPSHHQHHRSHRSRSITSPTTINITTSSSVAFISTSDKVVAHEHDHDVPAMDSRSKLRSEREHLTIPSAFCRQS